MTQDEIIRMAREAELYSYLWGGDINQQSLETLERFAALVAAHERERQAAPVAYKYKESSPETGEFVFANNASIEAAVLAEREACAKVCEWLIGWNEAERKAVEICAATIRARGSNGSR